MVERCIRGLTPSDIERLGADEGAGSSPASPANSEIERLRDIIRSCVGGSEVIDLGNGEHWCLHMPNKHLRKLVPEALK